MDRRSFITANKSASRIEPSEFRTFTGLSSYTPPFSSADIIHLLKRTLFGLKQSDIDLLSGKALIESLDLLLTTSSKPSSPLAKDQNQIILKMMSKQPPGF